MIDATLSGNAVEGLRDLAGRASNPRAMLIEVGRRGSNELKKWFRSRNRIPNKLGGRRSNIWLKIADSVQQPTLLGTKQARISVTHPFIRQKVEGGIITAKRAKALTIPDDPLAYGRTVAVFEQETGIKLFAAKKNSAVSRFLFGKVGTRIKVFYVLAKSVRQDKDPQALPPKDAWNAALLDQATKHLARQDRSTNPS